jgi:hypothetical protein
LGWNENKDISSDTKTPKTTTPKTPRVKKDKKPGSATNKTPSKVTKPRARKGPKVLEPEENIGSIENDMAVEYEAKVDGFDEEEMLDNQFGADMMDGLNSEGGHGDIAFMAHLQTSLDADTAELFAVEGA